MENNHLKLTNNEEALNKLFPKYLKAQETTWALKEARLCLLRNGKAIEANGLRDIIKENEIKKDSLNEQIWRIFDKDQELYDLYLKYASFMDEAREEGRKPQKHYFN